MVGARRGGRFAVLLVTLLLAGCNNGGEVIGDGGPARVESPVPDAADLAAPPTEQDGAASQVNLPLPPSSLAHRTRGAALDFAEYAVEVVDYVTATGDVTPLQQISYGCRGCAGVIEDVGLVYGQGGWSRGGDWQVLSSNAVADGRHAWDVSLNVHAQRQRVKRSSESTVEFLPGGRRTVAMSVAFAEGTWVLTALSVA